MVIAAKGWNQQLMMSLFKRETAYAAAVTVNSSNFCGIKGHSDYDPDFGDELATDKDTVSGYEHGTEQEIVSYGFKMNLTTPHVTPNLLIGGVALALGSVSSTKDGANDAWTHAITEVNDGTAIPSVNLVGKKGGKQYLHKGVKCGGFEIKGEANKPVSFTMNLVGSGDRTADSSSFQSPVSESWLQTNPVKIWLESGADISIDTTPTQGTQAISSSTPDNVSALLKSWSIKYNGALDEQRMGGGGYSSDITYGRRSYELSVEMLYSDYLALYEAQTVIAMDFDCAGGAKIDSDGSLYYGFKIVFPQLRIKKIPFPKGGVGDVLKMTFDLDVEEDGTHKPFYFWGYNGTAAYLA